MSGRKESFFPSLTCFILAGGKSLTVTAEGYVEKIVYRNTENGFTVLSLSEKEEELCCVGILSPHFIGNAGEGDYKYSEADGKWK